MKLRFLILSSVVLFSCGLVSAQKIDIKDQGPEVGSIFLISNMRH